MTEKYCRRWLLRHVFRCIYEQFREMFRYSQYYLRWCSELDYLLRSLSVLLCVTVYHDHFVTISLSWISS